ncbi:MAG: hypothetical protein C4543_07770, partial [Ignavibacteriales bacterium]
METLSLNIFLQAADDIELSRYKVMAAIKNSSETLHKNMLYPDLAELIKLYSILNDIVTRRTLLHDSLPSKLVGFDLENKKAIYEKEELSESKTKLVFDFINWAMPKIKEIIDEGKAIERWHEERRASVFDEGKFASSMSSKAPDVLYVQVDGTGINDRGSKEWMECKVGASYSQRVRVSKNRIKLLDKKSYAAIEDVDSFGQKFFLDCVSQGVLSAKKVIFVADGDRWIRRIKNDYFPEAMGVLDPWHLQRLLKVTLGEEKYDLVELCMSAAFTGDGVKIINLLLGELRDIDEPEKNEKIASVIKIG